MNIENLSLVVDNINYLNQINCNFEFNKIYALVGDTSVNVFLRVLCNLIKPTLGSIKITDNTNLGFFLNDMHFINDFDAIETLEDISTTKLDKKEISVLLNKVDLLKDSKLEIKNYSENMLKKLGIICTTLNNNKIILIEDVFKSLTQSDIDAVRIFLLNLKSNGYLIIITGRQKEEFTYFVDKIYELESGTLNEIL
ncbi:aBC transporter ATP-binding protein [Mycoplasma sp. CAG:956]|nr:aBC transporter ATP-binding protein [Mycoplasma sp. CAG:956]